MKKNTRTGSRLFFIEFIIVLFFFLIVSTVCLRMFARAHGITRRADALSHAQAAAASVAATVENVIAGRPPEVSATDNAEALADAPEVSAADSTAMETDASALLRRAAESLPGASLTNHPYRPEARECLVLPYDENFQPCGAEDAQYLLTATLGEDGQTEALETLQIEVHDYNQNVIYELSASFHRPATRKEALG